MLIGILYMAVAWTLLIGSVAWVAVLEYLDVRREKAMVLAAQNLELAEGVTLLQAVRAYYGEDGDWETAQGLVCIFAGDSRYRRGDVRVNLDTGEVMAYRGGDEADKAESEALVKAMVLAAKRGERGPWP